MSKLILFLSLFSSFARAELCNPDQQFCANDHHHTSSSSHPTSSSRINFNPSTVPTSRGLGLEFLIYKGIDYSLVTGTGRVGAAISPSNSDETFFGAAAFESLPDYQTRKMTQTKYATQKYTLATAFNIYNNEESGLSHLALNLGVMAKYNSVSNAISPGGGLSGLVGPISFSYAVYGDESDYSLKAYVSGANERDIYQVQTYSLGLSLGSLSVDYSVLNLNLKNSQITGTGLTGMSNAFSAVISVATATLFYKRGIYTLASRQEDSLRPTYDYATQSLISQFTKKDFFASIQYVATQHFFVGLLYNYYLLQDLSLGLTLFF